MSDLDESWKRVREKAMAKFRALVASSEEPEDGCLAGRWPPGPSYVLVPAPETAEGAPVEGEVRRSNGFLYLFERNRWIVWSIDYGTKDPRTLEEVTDRISYRVKQQRERANMTRAELGRRANISSSYVTHIESGRRLPTVPVLVAMASAFGISLNALIDVDEVVDDQG